VQDRSHTQQQQRAQGLNLVVAAIILWNTLELARAIEELRGEGVEMWEYHVKIRTTRSASPCSSETSY
jgi:TnpA family transposase